MQKAQRARCLEENAKRSGRMGLNRLPAPYFSLITCFYVYAFSMKKMITPVMET